jgi:serine/threonine protein kinase/Tol biopolymer transport system component
MMAVLDQGAPRLIGTLQIVREIGRGGMGIVYLARDTKLNRDVALKTLPGEFSSDPDRLARFQREARTLASLNNPRIASIYGLEEADDRQYLVLEYVPGETLDERLRRGPMRVDEAIDVGLQIAEAVEAAHRKGIVHRDLKPANIKFVDHDTIKVLDFGIAKALERHGDGIASASPNDATTVRATITGAVLGTPGYLSPEQARGRPVDERADIFNFGGILYEMLSGRVAYPAETLGDAISAVLEREPDWSLLPATLTPVLRRLLRRCVAKDPRRRLQSIGDARLELEELASGAGADDGGGASAPPSRSSWRALAGWVVAAVLALGLGASLWRLATSRHPRNPLAGATFTEISDVEGTYADASISPDGKLVSFLSDRDGHLDVWAGQVDTGRFRNMTNGTVVLWVDPIRVNGFDASGEEVWVGGSPGRRFKMGSVMGGELRPKLGETAVSADWSPDGRLVTYRTMDAGDPLHVANSDGSDDRVILSEAPGGHQHYPAWSTDGRWIYVVRVNPTTWDAGLWRVRADGSARERLTENLKWVAYPTPLDERTVLFIARDPDGAGPWMWAIDPETRVCTRVTVGPERYTSLGASRDRAAPRLITTIARPRADLWRLPILTDRPATEDDVQPFKGLPTERALCPRFGGQQTLFYLSSCGTGDGLWRYRAEEGGRQVWKGTDTALFEPVAVSPDGRRVTVVLRGEGRRSIHILSADGSQLSGEISEGIDVNGSCSWSPDGQWIVTGGTDDAGAGLFRLPVNGGKPQRILDAAAINPVWSPRNDLIIYAGQNVQGHLPLVAVRPDGTPVDLPPIEVMYGGQRFRFLPDGSGLVYMRRQETSQDFWLLDLDSMHTRQLSALTNVAAMRTFDVTPDGSEIVFDRLSRDSDLVLIELPPRER